MEARFPADHEKNVLASELLVVKSLPTSSVRGIIGQKFEFKTRHVEIVEHKGILAVLVYKVKKGELGDKHQPMTRLNITSPLSLKESSESGYYLLHPLASSDLALCFPSVAARNAWEEKIRDAEASTRDSTVFALSVSNTNPNVAAEATLEAKPSPPPFMDHPVVSDVGPMSTSRTRGAGVGRNLSIGEHAVGDVEPTRRKTKETTLAPLSAGGDILLPQHCGVASKADPFPNTLSGHTGLPRVATESPATVIAPMQLEELSVTGGVGSTELSNYASQSPSLHRRAHGHGHGHGHGHRSDGFSTLEDQQRRDSASASPTSRVRFTDEASESKSVVEDAQLLHQQVQVLSIMNEQLNAALEQSERDRREEVEGALDQVAKFQRALQLAELEKTDFVSKNQAAFDDLKRFQLVQMEKDKGLAELEATGARLQEALEEIVHLRRLRDESLHLERERIEGTRTLQESLGKKDAEITRINERLVEVLEALASSSGALSSKETRLQVILAEQAELVSDKTILQDRVASLESALAAMKAVKVESQEKSDRILQLEKDLQSLRIELLSAQGGEDAAKTTILRLESLVNEQQLFVQELTAQLTGERRQKEELKDSTLQHIKTLDELKRSNIEKGDYEREAQRLQGAVASLESRLHEQDQLWEERLAHKCAELEGKRRDMDGILLDNERLLSEVKVLQRRVDLMKEQNSQMVSDEELGQRRLALETEALASQLVAMRSSLSSSQQAYQDLQARHHAMEAALKNELKDVQGSLFEQEEVVKRLKELSADHVQRTAALEQELSATAHQLLAEKSRLHSFKEEVVLQQAHTNAEKKLLQAQAIELRDSVAELELLVKQRDKALRDLDERHKAALDAANHQAKESKVRFEGLENVHLQLLRDVEAAKETQAEERREWEERVLALHEACTALQMKAAEQDKAFTTAKSEKQHGEHAMSMRVMQLEKALAAASAEKSAGDLATMELQLSLERETDSVRTMQETLNKLKEALEKAAAEVKTKHLELQGLQARLEDSQAAFHQAERDNANELNKQREERSALEARWADQSAALKSNIGRLEEALALKSSALSWCERQLEDASAAAVTQQQQLELIQGDLTEVQLQLAALSETNQQLKQDREDLHKTLRDRDAKLAQCTRAESNYAQQVAALVAESADLRQQVAVAADAQAHLSKEHNASVANARQLMSRVSELDNKAMLEDLQRYNATKEMERYRRAHEESHAALTKVVAQLKQCQDEGAVLTEQLTVVTEALARAEEQMKVQSSEATQRVAERDAMISALEKDRSVALGKVELLDETARRLEDQLARMVDAEAAGQQVACYHQELQGLRLQHDRLYDKFLDASKRLALADADRIVCLQSIDRMAAALKESGQWPSVVGDADVALPEHVLQTENAVATLCGDLFDAQSFVKEVLSALCLFEGDPGDSEEPGAHERAILVELQALERVHPPAAMGGFLSQLHERLRAATRWKKARAEAAAGMQELRADLERQLLGAKTLLEQATEQLRALREIKQVDDLAHDEQMLSLRHELQVTVQESSRLSKEHHKHVEELLRQQEETLCRSRDELSAAHDQRVSDLSNDFQLRLLAAKDAAKVKEAELFAQVQSLSVQLGSLQITSDDQGQQLERQLQAVAKLEEIKAALGAEVKAARAHAAQEAVEQTRVVAELRARLQDLTNAVDASAATIANKEHTVSLLIEQKVALEGQLSGLDEQLKAAQRVAIEQTNILHATIRELQQKLDKTTFLLAAREEELHKSYQDQGDLHLAVNTARAEANERRTQLEQRETEAKELRRCVGHLEPQLISKASEVASLQDEKMALVHELSAVGLLRDDLARQLKAAQEDFRAQQLAYTKISTRLMESGVELDAMADQRAALQARLDDTTAQCAQDQTALSKEIQALQTQLRDLQMVMDKQTVALGSREREIGRLKEEKEFLSGQLEEIAQTLSAVEQTHAKAWNDLQSEHRELRLRSDKVAAHSVAKDQEIAKLLQAKEALEGELDSLSEQNRRQEASSAALLQKQGTELRELRHRVEKLSGQAALKDQELDRCQRERAALEEQLEQALAAVRDLETSSAGRVSDLGAELRETRQKLEKATQLLALRDQESSRLLEDNSVRERRLVALEAKAAQEEALWSKEKTELAAELAHVRVVYEEVVGQLGRAEKDLANVNKGKAAVERQLEDSLRQFGEAEEALSRDLHALQQEHRELQHKGDKQAIALASRERDASRLKEEKASLERQLEVLLKRLRDEDEEHLRQLSSIQTDFREAKQRADKACASLGTKEQELAKLLAERRALEAQLEESQREQRDGDAVTGAKLSELQVGLRDERGRAERLAQQLAAREQELVRVGEERAQAKAELEKALNRIVQQDKAYGQDLATLRTDVKVLRDEVELHANNLDRRSKELARALEERDALDQELAESAENFATRERRLQQDAKELRDDLWRARQQVDSQQLENQRQGQELHSALQQKAHLEEHVVTLRTSLEEKQRGMAQEGRRLQDELLTLQQVVDRQHAALERKEQDLVALRDDLNATKVDLKAKERSVADLTAQTQIAELAAAREQRQKAEVERLLRKSLTRTTREEVPVAREEAPRPASASRAQMVAAAAPSLSRPALAGTLSQGDPDLRSSRSRRLAAPQPADMDQALAQRLQRSFSSFTERRRQDDGRGGSTHGLDASGKRLGLRDLL